MAVRAKTRRRLRILLLTILAVGVLGSAGYFLRKRQINARVLRDRDAGYIALEQGDYYNALHKIGTYVQRHPDDPEALAKYAKARSKVEEPNNKQIGEAIALYRRLLDLQPNNTDAYEQLLSLYDRVHFDSEILTRTKDRNDAASLAARSKALWRTLKTPEAIEAATAYCTLKPLDLRMQMFLSKMLIDSGNPTEAFARATRLQQQQSDEPRFRLLLAFVCKESNDVPAANKWIDPVVSGKIDDADVLDLSIALLDELGRYSDALAVLKRSSGASRDIDFERRLVARLYRSGQYSEVAERLKPLDSDLANADADLVAHRAMALRALNANFDATKLVDSLAQRKGNFTATAWAGVLSALPQGDAFPNERKIIDACREGLKSSPTNPYFHLYLGDALVRLGEIEPAIEEWQRAIQLGDVWPTPRARIMRVLIGTGRSDLKAFAESLAQLAASEPESLAVAAWAMSRNVPSADSPEAANVSKILTQVQSMRPGEEISFTLILRRLTSQKRSEDVRSLIQQASRADAPKRPQSNLLLLAQASESLKLGMEDACFARCEALYGNTPLLATARAAHLMRAGRKEDARKLFESARASAASRDDLAWQLGWAHLLDAISDPGALKQWNDLAEHRKEDPTVQFAVVSAKSTQSDRELMRRAIDRLGAVVSEQGVAWRIADARWIMQGAATKEKPSEREQDLAKAATILSDVTRRYPELTPARLLLGECMYRLDKKDAAIEQLTMVAQRAPNSLAINLQLASLLQGVGDFAKAKPYLEQSEKLLNNLPRARAAQKTDVQRDLEPAAPKEAETPDEQSPEAAWRTLASLLVARGEVDHAIQILSRLDAEHNATVDVGLAGLMSSRGSLTDEDCNKLLSKPTPRAIVLVATHYATINRQADADKTIAMLDGLTPSAPGEKEFFRGVFLQRTGKNLEAVDQFRAACAASPKNADAWRALISTQLANGKLDDAISAASDAHKAIPEDAGFARVVEQSELIRAVADVAMSRPLVLAIVADDEHAETIIAALKVVREGRSSNKLVADVRDELRRLSDKQPSFIVLLDVIVTLDMRSGEFDDAISVATRWMQLAPAEPLPAQRVAEALAEAGRWDQVIPVAQEWRNRLGARTRPADEALAAAYISTKNYAAAEKQLAPFKDEAAHAPADNAGFLSMYSRSLIGQGRNAEALAFFDPFLSVNAGLREEAIRISTAPVTSHANAMEWLEHVEAKIPKDAFAEWYSLIASRIALLNRAGDGNGQQERERISAELADLTHRLEQSQSAKAEDFGTLGMLKELAHDDAGAATAYRASLRVNPDLAVAQNNLAMLLLRTNGDLKEALELATKATSKRDEPGRADFLDTLAQIQAKLGNSGDASASLTEAVQLQPQNRTFRASLVEALIQQGRIKESQVAFGQLEKLMNAAPRPDAETLARVSALRGQLEKTTSSK